MPERFSVEIPEILLEDTNSSAAKVKKNKQNQQKLEREIYPVDENASYVYPEAKGFIKVYNVIERKMIAHYYLIDKILNGIVSVCEETADNEVCSIPSNTLQVSLTEEETAYLSNLTLGEINNTSNTTIDFGAIEFTQYSNANPYDYELRVDMSNFYEESNQSEESNNSEIQDINWIEDGSQVLSATLSRSTTTTNEIIELPMNIYYDDSSLTQERMFVNVKFHDLNESEPLSNGHLSLTKSKVGEKKTSVEMHRLAEGVSESIYVELNEERNGFGILNTLIFAVLDVISYEIHDNTGLLLAQTGCTDASSLDDDTRLCTFDDFSSWLTTTTDESVFEPITTLSRAFKDLKIKGGNLKNGDYFLLAPDVNITALTLSEITHEAVGMFIHLKETNRGSLYDLSYADDLDSLQVVYLQYNDDVKIGLSQRLLPEVEIVAKADKPIIAIEDYYLDFLFRE